MAIAVTTSILPSQEGAPLDARTVIQTLNSFKEIQNPYIGLVFYAKDTGRYYKVIALQQKTQGLSTINVIKSVRRMPDTDIQERLTALEDSQIFITQIE